ncbi:MAG: hypothetical protein GF383_01135 [Candidatus Lokiarchaeota archaeon]|nr:hypothetical protein [Candidatus Lokiarchaeota archaeon]MBD3337854.1 hypothetical protein [Candidatus Lokiarchaeota archaeon]
MAVTLTPIEWLQSISVLIFIIISLILGIKIILKYFKHERKELLFAGLTIILMLAPYYNDPISFFLIITTGKPVDVIIIYLGIGIVALANITWGFVYTELLKKEKQRLILGFLTAQTIIFEFILIYAIFFNPSLILIPFGDRFYREAPLLIGFYIFWLILYLFMGFSIAIVAYKSDNREVHLKGIFLLLAMSSYVVGTLLDFAIEISAITIIVGRIIMITSYIEFYLGFILPNWVKDFFIKSEAE